MPTAAEIAQANAAQITAPKVVPVAQATAFDVATVVPEKHFLASNTTWASIATFVIGLATSVGLSQDLAAVLKAQVEPVIGVVLTLVGVYGAFANLRRKSTLTL